MDETDCSEFTKADWGFLTGSKYSVHDRDTKFRQSFPDMLETST